MRKRACLLVRDFITKAFAGTRCFVNKHLGTYYSTEPLEGIGEFLVTKFLWDMVDK